MNNHLLSHLTRYYSAGIQNLSWSNFNTMNFPLNYTVADDFKINFEGLYYKVGS